ncbi:MAG: universal stress protein [Candidatus Competibacterales bacterium]|nr:universal stress protein [Candidatus Competibacterales bacterium]
MLQTILVGVDGSENAKRALDFAVELAKKFSARLLLLSVYKHHSALESTYTLAGTRETAESPDQVLSQLAKQIVEAAAERVRQNGVDQVKTLVRRGPPARTIVEEAKKQQADTIVMGSRGLGDLSGFLLGSVSHKVSSLAECTCITVK